jgi:hypothetical protein
VTGGSLADRATDSAAFRIAARTGYLATGILHLLLAYVIVRLVLRAGSAGVSADQSGALATIAGGIAGVPVLWVVCVAFVGLGLWRLAEIVTGTHPTDQRAGDRAGFERLKAAGLAVIYFALAFSAAQFALGAGRNSGEQNVGLSARLMQSDWGRGTLVAVGVAVVAIGGYHVYKGVAKTFLNDLDVSGSPVINVLGVTGYVTRGAAIGGAGVMLIVATVRSNPAQASGLDAAVGALSQTSGGKAALIIAAAGLVAYGFFSFASSRLARL